MRSTTLWLAGGTTRHIAWHTRVQLGRDRLASGSPEEALEPNVVSLVIVGEDSGCSPLSVQVDTNILSLLVIGDDISFSPLSGARK